MERQRAQGSHRDESSARESYTEDEAWKKTGSESKGENDKILTK